MARRTDSPSHARARRPRGRPRQGRRPGERVRDYPTITIRLPDEERAMLKALCVQLRLPMWQTVRHLTVCFVRSLPAHERRKVMNQAKAKVEVAAET